MKKYLTSLKFSIKIFYNNKIHIALILLCLIISISFSYILFRKAFHDNQINKHFSDYKSTYRLTTYYKSYDMHSANYDTGFLFEIKSQIPEIKYGTSVLLYQPKIINDVKQEEELCKNFFLMDNDAFEIFSMTQINGSKLQPLKKGEILLSESQSEKLFKSLNSVGEIISIEQSDQKYEFIVAGVFRDFCEQSTFTPNYVIGFNSFYTYEQVVKMKSQIFLTLEANDIEKIIVKINELNPYPDDISFNLQAIDKIYFHSSHLINDFINDKGNLLFHKLGILVSAILIIFGFINFLSLSLTFYIHRFKELYIRKVNGSVSKDFSIQIFLELFILFLLSIFISYVLISIVRWQFNTDILSDTYLSISQNVYLLLIVLLTISLFIFITVFILKKVLFNKYLTGYWNYIKYTGKQSISKIFNIFQLSIVILLFIFITTITKQLSYSSSNVKGYHHNNLLQVNFPVFSGEPKYDLLKEKLLNFPEIKCISGAYGVPMANAYFLMNLTSKIDNKEVTFEVIDVDEEYFNVLKANFVSKIELKTLENFSNTDIIINKTGLNALGLKIFSDEIIDGYTIKAVVNDINYETTANKIPPRVYMISKNAISSLLIRHTGEDIKALYEIIPKQYKDVFPDFNVEIKSYDDIISKAYANDIELRNILIIVLAVMFLLTAFGFFSIADYEFIKKSKGIAISRMLGAKLFSMVGVNIKQSLYVFAIASVIAVVSGYYLSIIWLDNFFYKIDIDLKYFIISILVGFLIIALNILIFIRKVMKLDICLVIKENKW